MKVQHLGKFHSTVSNFGRATLKREFRHPETVCYQHKDDDDHCWFLWDVATNKMRMMNKYNFECGRIIHLTQVYPVSFSGP